MNAEKFVSIINEVVVQSTIDGTKKVLSNPRGRSPAKELVKMSIWYNNLSDEDKEVVGNIIARSVRGAIFGFLCVLDGVRAIEDRDKGVLKLYYERNGESVLLNDQSSFGLHEML